MGDMRQHFESAAERYLPRAWRDVVAMLTAGEPFVELSDWSGQ